MSIPEQNNQELVSVITAAYNCAKFIKSTIQSVQAQTYENWEMIIVDDCSKDNTAEVILAEAENDPRIKYIKLEKNSGAAVARNTAINEAKGKFIAFLDSDDQWVPHKLERQISYMKENDYAFTFTGYRIIDEEGEPTDQVVQIPKEIDYEGLLKNTIIGCLTVVVNKEKTGHFQMPNIRTRQDFALWLLILKRGFKAYGIQEELALYRKVKGSISSNKIKAAKQNWYVYRKIENLGLVKAMWVFGNYAYTSLKKTL
ncbi:glycosyltransferase family 2 protein [Pseudalkalibacillus sp. R45]|uniref:glycosyltransferase family 2 protein n=1 Tax=Pseudalkalibacillus sp. R45 TaxID=3457433 RepID=UPI003FCC8A58